MQSPVEPSGYGHLIESVKTPNKVGKLVLAPSDDPAAFDYMGLDCAFPYFHEGRYYMTYVGWDGRGYRTGLASSNDLLTWEKEGLLIDRGPIGSVTEHNVALTSILRDNELYGSGELRKVGGVYVGTYHAYPSTGYEEGSAVIGLCYSKDLRNWEIGEPVLQAQASADWEAGGLYKSWLMESEGTYFLFYNAKTIGANWIEQTGVATSTNLKTWRRHELNPLLPVGPQGAFDDIFASDPCVLRHDGKWLMFYFGNSSDGHARESVAFSNDLIHWTKSNRVLIDVGGTGSVDSHHAHKAGLIVSRDKKLFHFYTAVSLGALRGMNGVQSDRFRGISLATS